MNVFEHITGWLSALPPFFGYSALRLHAAPTISMRSRRWLAERRSGPQSSSTNRSTLTSQPREAAVAVGEIEIEIGARVGRHGVDTREGASR
jgi:hypothetical protein